MDKLQNALAEVEKIDDQLIALLNQRYQATRETVKYLREQDLPVYDPSFQQQIINRLLNNSKGPMTPEILCAIYREIFSGSLLKIFCDSFNAADIPVAYL